MVNDPKTQPTPTEPAPKQDGNLEPPPKVAPKDDAEKQGNLEPPPK